MGLAHGDTLFAMIPAFSRISISSCTHCTCLRAKVYGPLGHWGGGGYLPWVYPFLKVGFSLNLRSPWKRLFQIQNIGPQMLSCVEDVTSASLNLMGSRGSMSAGEVMKPFPSPLTISSSTSPGAQGSSTLTPKISSCVIIISSVLAF